MRAVRMRPATRGRIERHAFRSVHLSPRHPGTAGVTPLHAIGAGIAAWLARVVASSPAPDAVSAAAVTAIVVAAVLWTPTWRVLRHGITIVHEAGHGAAATLTGRRLAGIRLHSDTSGLTVSVGKPRGPGMVLTLAAGYPAPCVAGLLAAWAVGAGHAAIALWGALVLLAAVLLQIRNWFGLWTLLVSGTVIGAATWLLDPAWQMRIALTLAGVLLTGGLRAVLELPAARRGGRRGRSDADQLARLTVLPAGGWVAAFVVLAAAALPLAVALIAGGV